jgi:RHS repeat-associated protein
LTRFSYDRADVVIDKNSDGTSTEYLNGPGIDNKLRQKSKTATYYYVTDHLGSITALTDTKGKVIEKISYDSFGDSTGSTRTRYGYTQRERDSLTGLIYYRARWYDPQLGRFISEDPIEFEGGSNWYAYVDNNPLRYIDPLGLDKYVLIVGDPGRGSHNAGNNFNRSAQSAAEQLRAEGHEVIISRASSVTDFNRALNNNGKIDGGVIYYGHGWIGKLYIGEGPEPGTNLDASNIDQLSGENLGPNATIILNSCNSATGEDSSIGQLMANQLGRRVFGSTKPMKFSGKSCDIPSREKFPPNKGPIRMCPESGGRFRDFVPQDGPIEFPNDLPYTLEW